MEKVYICLVAENMWEKVGSEIANGSYSLICLSIRQIFFWLCRASLNLSIKLSLFANHSYFCGESFCLVADQMWENVGCEIGNGSHSLICLSIRDIFFRLCGASLNLSIKLFGIFVEKVFLWLPRKCREK